MNEQKMSMVDHRSTTLPFHLLFYTNCQWLVQYLMFWLFLKDARMQKYVTKYKWLWNGLAIIWYFYFQSRIILGFAIKIFWLNEVRLGYLILLNYFLILLKFWLYIERHLELDHHGDLNINFYLSFHLH